jgi:hypothetical protein
VNPADAALFSLEAKMPDGATVAIPAELLAAVQASCILPIGDDAKLAAGRDAFVRRFLTELFARGLLLAPRGDSKTREAINLNIYTMVCSQKHALQTEVAELGARLEAIAGLVAPSDEAGDLLDELEALVASLTGRAPPSGAVRAAHVGQRVAHIQRLALQIADEAVAIGQAPEGAA